MCVACKYPSNSLAAANPETAVVDFGLSTSIAAFAREQRANLDMSHRILCEFHQENYRRVVEALESAAAKRTASGARPAGGMPAGSATKSTT